ncbi:MAG: hypothetical protein OER21_08285 [Gemmatimonadota bacterium]|nr:hypothetical protein [Gemmatimonadota bacterium]
MHVRLAAPLAWRLTIAPVVHAIRPRVAGAHAALVQRLRRISREQVLWTVMAIVLLLFVLVLVTQPTGVGRGGR